MGQFTLGQPESQAANFESGFNIGRLARQDQAKYALEAQTNALYKAAVAGSPQAMEQLAMVKPEAVKSLQDYNTYKTGRTAQYMNAVLAQPEPEREAAYERMKEGYQREFKEVAPVPARYSPEAASHLKDVVMQARDVEKVAAEQFEAPKRDADIANIKARTRTEGYQPDKILADIANTKANTFKTGLESQQLISDAEAANTTGLSPAAYKETQKELAKNTATTRIALPKLETQAASALKLINDITSHPGMSSMVGIKNPFSGASGTFIPFTDKNPVSGSQAANFKAKFEQLQGKNFLSAYESLKGSGAISEIESVKATKAISDMSMAQSESEFLKSANELKDVIRIGLENARNQARGVYNAPSNQSGFQEGQTATNPTTGQTLTFRGGRWQ